MSDTYNKLDNAHPNMHTVQLQTELRFKRYEQARVQAVNRRTDNETGEPANLSRSRIRFVVAYPYPPFIFPPLAKIVSFPFGVLPSFLP